MSYRKIFSDSVEQLPDLEGQTANGLKVQAINPENRDEKMSLHFALAIPQQAHDDLEALVAKGGVVTPAELSTKYSVPESEVTPLVNWLKAAGYEVTRVSADGTSVYANASVAQIEQSLGVKMVQVTKDGITYTAAQNAPSLPADIAQSVHAIGGLQPFRHAHRHNRRLTPTNRNGQIGQGAAASGGLTTNIANKPPYLVSEILKAYGADGLGLTGKGQSIAILIDTFPADTDLQAFWKYNGLSIGMAQIHKINVKNVTPPPTEGEETLDAEWTSGIAPGANIRIYASGSLQFVDLDLALDKIIQDFPTNPGMRQLSISLGLGETFMQKAEVRTQHQKFLRLAALGINVFISSGDAGSNPDNTGHSSNGPLQAEYGSSDSCVVGVGGTSLKLGPAGAVVNETGWADGGGGRSVIFGRPSWQVGPGVTAGKNRLVPDVSLAADPNEGAFLILNGQPQQIGGTSWSTPVWAGFCALINEARVKAGKSPLPFLNPLIYPLIGTSCFRDIVSGSNGAYHAQPNYDMVTGIGVPDVKALLAALTK